MILHGKASPFTTSDITACDHVQTDDVAACDAEMAAIGFAPLGDLECARMPGTLIRGYAGRDGVSFATAMAANQMFVREFYTSFDNGSSITTTSVPMAMIHCPKHEISCHPTAELDGIYAAHRARIGRIKPRADTDHRQPRGARLRDGRVPRADGVVTREAASLLATVTPPLGARRACRLCPSSCSS